MLLFNPSKTFSRSSSGSQDVDLMIDCFLSCFRITPHNNDLLKICLNTQSPPTFHFVLVNVLYRIITQVGASQMPVYIPVFQLGIFPRALRPARTVLRPARFNRAIPNYYKKKFIFVQNVLLFFCFQRAGVKMLADLCPCFAHKIVPIPRFVRVLNCDRILVVNA